MIFPRHKSDGYKVGTNEQKKKTGKPKVNGTKWEPEMIVDIEIFSRHKSDEYKVGTKEQKKDG